MRFQITITSEFRAFVKELVTDLNPVALICFGHSSAVAGHKSCFQVSASEKHHYDLLVVQPDHFGYKDPEMGNRIKHSCPDYLSVNILSHNKSTVSAALSERDHFFCKLFREGYILHLSENNLLLADVKTGECSTDNQRFSKEWKRALELSDKFTETASDALGSQIHDVGLFLLHQAMEQMCIASIKVHLKYRPNTHNIAKLIALVGCYIPKVKDIFPRNTPEEKELFDFLRKANTDVRYKISYCVPSHIAFSLFDRVTEFKNIVEERYNLQFEVVEENRQQPVACE